MRDMIGKIFYGVCVGMAWAISLMFMGLAGRLMFELLAIGWRVLP